MRIICYISWGFALTMWFVPEPERNATNRLAAEKERERLAQLNETEFNHLRLRSETERDGPV